MTAKPPFVQINLDDTPKQLANKRKASRRAFKMCGYSVVRVFVNNYKKQADGEAMLLTFCGQVGALPQGKWDWRGRVLDITLLPV